MIEIHVSRMHIAIVDDEDSDLMYCKWHLVKSSHESGYATTALKIAGKWVNISMHRIIVQRQNSYLLNPKQHVDHKSGFKGVCFNKRSKLNPWTSQISVDYRTIYLGIFPTPEAAHIAYCEAAQKYFGEFWRAA